MGKVIPAIDALLDFIFPPCCTGCEAAIELASPKENVPPSIRLEQFWCSECLKQLRCTLDVRCPTCGAITPVHAAFRGRCHLCRFADYRFDQAICINNYQGLMQELIIKMKGRRCTTTALQLGRVLACELERLDHIDESDLLVPVPTFWWKKLQKGFQASELICESVSRISGIPRANRLLKAVRMTQKQGTLSGQKRYANVKGAFAIHPFFRSRIQGVNIVLVDDVMTSGATTSQCAEILKKAGANRVDVAVVARGAKAQ